MSASRNLELTASAQNDIADLLDHSAESFGPISRRRYEGLIGTGLDDLRNDPLRLGSVARPEVGEGVRIYHLRHSQDRARTSDGAVRRPRHLLVYRLPDPETVRVLRVLHDSMDLERHIPSPDEGD